MRTVLFVLVLGARVLKAQVPDGPGADVLKARCVSCHQADLITSQRLSAAAWTREVDKMVRWGAVVDAAQRESLESYLAANFRTRPAASHATTAAGEATFARTCLSCHGSDMVDSQKLTRAAWVREVEKMMRWGATVSDTEKDPLVDFLFAKTAAK